MLWLHVLYVVCLCANKSFFALLLLFASLVLIKFETRPIRKDKISEIIRNTMENGLFMIGLQQTPVLQSRLTSLALGDVADHFSQTETKSSNRYPDKLSKGYSEMSCNVHELTIWQSALQALLKRFVESSEHHLVILCRMCGCFSRPVCASCCGKKASKSEVSVWANVNH